MAVDCFLVRRATTMRASNTLRIIVVLIIIAFTPFIYHSSLSPPPTPLPRPPDLLLRFGLISDIQFVDADDVWDRSRFRRRHYRSGLARLKEAVDFWRAEDVDGVLQLGDLLDGSSLRFNQRDTDFASITRVASFLPVPWYHVIGNH